MSKATNPLNLRKGSRVVIVDPAESADWKRGHVGTVIDVVHVTESDDPETIVIVRCDDCTLSDDVSPNHHYVDAAADVERTNVRKPATPAPSAHWTTSAGREHVPTSTPDSTPATVESMSRDQLVTFITENTISTPADNRRRAINGRVVDLLSDTNVLRSFAISIDVD